MHTRLVAGLIAVFAISNVVISAATGTPTTDFGSSGGKEMTAIKA